MNKPSFRGGPHPGYRQRPSMDAFMFGQQRAPQMPRSSFPMNMSQLNPANLLNSPQISKGIGGISGILNNIQQILRVVETTTPIIQQYGPMIKNLPAMYRIVKAFKEIDDSPSVQEKTTTEEKVIQKAEEGKEEVSKPKVEKRTGVSTPKLYI